MLAPDEDGAAMDALRFSLASDIVELVVLTADGAFCRRCAKRWARRAACGTSRRRTRSATY